MPRAVSVKPAVSMPGSPYLLLVLQRSSSSPPTAGHNLDHFLFPGSAEKFDSSLEVAPLAETLSYSNSIVKINLGINHHKIPRYTDASDTKSDLAAQHFTDQIYGFDEQEKNWLGTIGRIKFGGKN